MDEDMDPSSNAVIVWVSEGEKPYLVSGNLQKHGQEYESATDDRELFCTHNVAWAWKMFCHFIGRRLELVSSQSVAHSSASRLGETLFRTMCSSKQTHGC